MRIFSERLRKTHGNPPNGLHSRLHVKNGLSLNEQTVWEWAYRWMTMRVKKRGECRLSARVDHVWPALSGELNINKEIVGKMLHENWTWEGFSQKWFQNFLPMNRKAHLLSRIQSEERDWISRVFTGDKTWIFEYDPDTRK